MVEALALMVASMQTSCTQKYKTRFADDKIEQTVKPYAIERFDQDFKSVNVADEKEKDANIEQLTKKYGKFLDLYTINLLGVGVIDSASTKSDLDKFFADKAYKAFYNAIDSVYEKGLKPEEEKINEGFNRFHHYFPNESLPNRIIANFSGFYSNMSLDDNDDLGISVEFYLGSDEKTFQKYYRWVDGLYEYHRQNLTREKIAPDVISAWTMYKYPMTIKSAKMLDEMVYNGKILYITEVMLPNESEENLMGYTKTQLDWCKANEKQMWKYIKENKHLYTFDRLTVSKYINPAPTTQYFPEDSPGKTGIWLGWQIVRSFMDNNKEVTLTDLMNMNDSQELLTKSRYNP